MTKPIIHIRKPRDWKNLHPAPRVTVEEKNCCDCVFFSEHISYCNLNAKKVNTYDECSAFTKKESPKP